MPDLNISKATIPTQPEDYSVPAVRPDSPTDIEETTWDNTKFFKWFGNYRNIAKIKKAIDGYATWILGKGYETEDTITKVSLEDIDGWGEDTFQSVLWNMIVTKKIGGDAFAHVIRDEKTGTIINFKPLNPAYVRIVANKKGRIKRYEYRHAGKNENVKYKPQEILHLCNNRVTDEIHGVSDIEAVEWLVEAQEEAMRDFRKMLHRNGVARVIYVDTDDTTKINSLKAQWKEAIEKGDVMILPKETAEVKDIQGSLQDPLPWIKYLDNLFYMSIGVPRVILGGSEEFTEASSKIGYLTFEQIYLREQTELEADLWKQCAIKIKFNKPASIKNELLQSEEKNTGQTGFQPSEATATLGRVE